MKKKKTKRRTRHTRQERMPKKQKNTCRKRAEKAPKSKLFPSFLVQINDCIVKNPYLAQQKILELQK